MSQPGGPIELPAPPPLRPRSVGEILSAAFQLYGRFWQTLIPLAAIVVIPLSILQYAVQDAVRGDALDETSVAESVANGLGGFVIGVGTIFLTLLLVGAIAWAAAGTLVGREPDMSDSYRFGLARFWSILLVGVLAALAIAGGFILLIVPGFIFLTRFSVSVPVLVVENKRGTAALSRSWDLVTGYSWPVFGTLIVAGLIAGLVSAILSAPFAGWFTQGILAGIGSAITMPFTALVVSLIYFDLRVRKEQLDVARLDAELQAAAP